MYINVCICTHTCVCVFGVSSTTTALHKYINKTIGNLTFSSAYYVPGNMPVSCDPV